MSTSRPGGVLGAMAAAATPPSRAAAQVAALIRTLEPGEFV